MGGHDEQQQVKGEFHWLAVLRIDKGEQGENEKELVADLSELKQKADKISVDHRYNEAGKGVRGERTCQNDCQSFFCGYYGEDGNQSKIQDSIFTSQCNRGFVCSTVCHGLCPCGSIEIAAGEKSPILEPVCISTRMESAAQAYYGNRPAFLRVEVPWS